MIVNSYQLDMLLTPRSSVPGYVWIPSESAHNKGATPSMLVRVVKPNLLFCVHQRYSEGVSRSKGECGGLSWSKRIVGGVVRGYREEEVSNESI